MKYITQDRGHDNYTINNDTTTLNRKSQTLFGLGFVEMISSPRSGFLRGVFLANHLARSDNLTSNNQETEHIQTQANVNTKVTLVINNNTHTKT